MDEKGFVYTLDTILALIPVMIVLFGVTHLTASPEPHSQVISSQKAQDTMQLMAQYTEGDGMTVLERISSILASGHNNEASIRKAGKIASSFLDKNFSGKYILTEESQLNGKSLAGNLDLKSTMNVATASRNCGSYTFRIYVEQ